jgi:ribosomal protein S27E
MKKALKITIKKYKDDELVDTNSKIVCGYCESGQVYNLKKENKIYCRICGETSKLEDRK